MHVLTALENLIKAVNDGDNINVRLALDDAIEALGYDPSKPEKYYTVSLVIDFSATSPEEAVKEFISAIDQSREGWVYTVKEENGEEVYVDTYGWKIP